MKPFTEIYHGTKPNLEAAADKLLAQPIARRKLMREEHGGIEPSADVLDFIINGGPGTPKAILGRLSMLAISAGLLDVHEAARITRTSVRSVQRLKKKCRQ